MIRKILSILCIGIICISIVNPIQIKADTQLVNYVDAPITENDFQNYVVAGTIATILGNGDIITIPDSNSLTTLTDDIWDYVSGSDLLNTLWDYAIDPKWIEKGVDYIKYKLFGKPFNAENHYDIINTGFQQLAQEYLDYHRENTPDQPTIDPDYSFVNDSKDFVLVSNNSSGSTTWIADNHGWSYRYDQSDYPYLMNKSDYTYVAYPNNTGNFFGGVNGFYLYDITTFYVTLDNINNKYIVTASGYNPKGFKPPNRIGYYTNWFGFYFDNGRLYANNFSTNTRAIRYPLEFNTLNDALVDICKYYRHFNLYVDNQPWILVNQSDPIQIGGNTYITNTTTPVQYSYPDNTFFDPAYLLHLLQSIDWNTKHTLTFEDIEDVFTDINGVTAVNSLQVHRSDYDVLIQEQYPYRTVPGENNYVLTRDSILETYNNQAKYIVKNMGTDAIPSDILRILGAAGALLLVAYLINRMLE